MTATSTAFEIYINTNVVLCVAVLVWAVLRFAVARGGHEHAFALQLGLLKTVLLIVAASPLLAIAATRGIALLSPDQSLVLGDLAVAAYLRGDIAMDAIRFENMLNARHAWTKDVLLMGSPLAKIVIAALLAGAAFHVLRLVVAALQIRGMISRSYLFKRSGRLEIRLSSHIAVPLATRWGRLAYVVLPCDLVARPQDLRFALAHELQHLRQRDIEWEFGFELLRPLVFWNPAYLLLKRQFDRLRELSCDQAVVAAHSFNRRAYANCLLRFCDRSRRCKGFHSLNVALVRTGRHRAKAELTQRVLALQVQTLGMRGDPFRRIAAVAISVIGISLAAASMQPSKDWSHDRLMLSTVVNLERLEALSRGY